MLRRLSEIFSSKWNGWGITTVLFGMWHVYQGPIGAISSLVYGGVLGLVVLYTRRVGAAIVVHAITNSILYVLTVSALRSRGYFG